ncbi:MAG: type II and III secretion system protein [Candidatus Cloacimonadaceae bacterium]|jgi:type IV pilus assembly protein PilQ|nr:type II and III secretion system protein [Candidatus Cloacimonadota bacterium]MDD3523437.1 type II and III secretion system protein [Candidatus Cloacimonadota bacterium]MDY0318518.1 type II and III secretion system protein [Candidatus Cloacimonadaceae bacterium]
MHKTHFIICLILMLLASLIYAQEKPAKVSRISMKEDTHINEAMQIMEHFSLQENGRKMLNLSKYNGSINIPISNLEWRRALDLILMQNDLKLEEGVGYYAVRDADYGVSSPGTPGHTEPSEEQKNAEAKQVRIKAVAMLADRSYLKNLGVDWSSVFNGQVTVNAGFAGGSQLVSPFTLSGSGSADIGKYTVDINTLIRTIESNQKGSILAEPSILVTSGKTGNIQVGQDISIKTADEAGNTKDSFYATGIIMNVTPTIVMVDGEELIMMKLSIERSSGQPSAISTVITKSTSSTELILYNREEAVIAGLFDTDETKVRSGVPILKDLPWWVFGLRYLTGYDSYEKRERELIITIRAEILDSALDRLRKIQKEAQEVHIQPE